MPSPLKVLLVDDSATSRLLLKLLISTNPRMKVIAEATNGEEAIKLTKELQPQIILMDIFMPKMDGLEACQEIMLECPTPIVMVSAGLDDKETDLAFQALRFGALSVLRKPVGPQDPNFARESQKLVSTVEAMADVRVIHHRRKTAPLVPSSELPSLNLSRKPEIVAIVASTGGPAALAEIFRQLPEDFPLPIAIVQHISAEFMPSLVHWLQTTSKLKVEIAEADQIAKKGHIYFAPVGQHLHLSRQGFKLEVDTKQSLFVPSGTILLESAAESYGTAAIGIVLTGMGDDGAKGLASLHKIGAYTIAQNEASSVVFGMPQEAIRLGAAHDVLSIEDIPKRLNQYLSKWTGA